MTVRSLILHRVIDLPPVIVWDALVDPVLVGGWLGEAVIDARPGGLYRVGWVGSVHHPALEGRIERMSPRESLTLSTDRHGSIRFTLHPLDGGTRGLATRLDVGIEVEIDPVFIPRLERIWSTALDQLIELLRGHPVEWVGAPGVDPAAPSQPRLA
ncbi:MAG: hypothetical protein RI885_579 [Actinomycetota bacterium]